MEMDQTEPAEVTPNVNNWRRKYSYSDQDVTKTTMDKSEYNMFETPHECRSGDSGFHSITPDSAESLQGLNMPIQDFGTHDKITPNMSLSVNFHPLLPINSTPQSCLEMETSLYPEDEEMKDHFLSNDTDDFNLNSVDENNVLIFKDEKSTNIDSLYDSGTDNKYFTPNILEEGRNRSFLEGSFSRRLSVSNSAQNKSVAILPQALFNTPSTEHLLISNSSICVEEEFSECTQPVEEKRKIDLNFNVTNLEYILQNINSLPPLQPSIKISRTSPTECVMKKKRFLNGIEQVDILYLLGVKENFLNIVTKIFSYLTPYDMMNVQNVSTTWNQIFSNITPYQKKWKEFKKQHKDQKENVLKDNEHSDDFKFLRKRGRQTYLSTIENTSSSFLQTQKPSPQLSPKVSPSKRRFHLFQKEGQKLKQGERLLRCPKCTFPSHDPGSTYATCTRVGCKYEFCIFCCGEYSSNHHCPPLYTPRPCKRTATIGSKGSKRNLRRL